MRSMCVCVCVSYMEKSVAYIPWRFFFPPERMPGDTLIIAAREGFYSIAGAWDMGKKYYYYYY